MLRFIYFQFIFVTTLIIKSFILKSKILILSIAISLMLTASILWSFSNPKTISCGVKQIITPTCTHLEYDFAGEKIPTQDPEVFERLDRELLVNTYWQSSTLMSLKLADKYFPIIEPILKKYGIPDDFKYLAMVESGLRDVVSPSGASGKWQFMRETGTSFGLVINDEIDERYHLEKSTEAACKYFINAYTTLGSWSAVAGGFNMGISGIYSKMKEQNETSYFNLHLNQETARYVFRIVALKAIHKNPQNFGYHYSQENKYPEWETERATLYLPNVNLTEFANSKGTNYKTIRYLNPWIRSNKITTLKDSIEIVIPKMQ
jgi:membrane-bound lytic murein transglycosylase D